jgi:hypothetical protein
MLKAERWKKTGKTGGQLGVCPLKRIWLLTQVLQ